MIAVHRCLGAVIQRNLRITSKFLQRNLSSAEDERSKKSPPSKTLPAIRNPFDSAQQKTKESFVDMVAIFESRDVHRRNHVEFIYAALKNMEEFGVHTDIEVYKALINVMPKGKFIPANIFQAEFMHYPKQQQCIIDLLEQMEDNGVIPDYEMEAMLLNVFGRRGHPVRKYWRMMYWMPKFKNLSPWPVPNPPPSDIQELARLAIERMCTVDVRSQIEMFDTQDVEDSIDKTWIVSGMSVEQSELLKEHKKPNPIYIEGPSLIWMRNKSVHYFTLRSDPDLDKLEKYKESRIEDTDGKFHFVKIREEGKF